MIKKAVKIVITLMLCICFMQSKVPVHAAETDTYFTVDNVQYKKLSGSKVAVWDASSVEGDYKIPSKVKHNNSNYSVTEISYKAFYGNEKLTSIVMPDTITKIQDGREEEWVYYGAFSECKNLKTVTFSKNLTHIGMFAFSGDELLKNVVIPNKVKKIMDEAFNNCKGITRLTIPKTTTYVGQCAFSGTSLVTFKVPKTCSDFHCLALDGISTLTDINVEKGNIYYISLDGIMYNIDMTRLECYPAGRKDRKYVIPESVKVLNIGIFSGNKYLRELVVNKTMDESAFGPAILQKTNISSIKVSAKNPYLKSIDGVLFTKDGKTLLLYPPAKKGNIYFIPAGTKHIGNGDTYTFESCLYLKELYIPASVETMTGNMWYSKKLKQVVFASNSKLTTMDGFMFQYCTSLESICFPKSFNSLSDDFHGNEFLFCEKLKVLYAADGAGLYNCKKFGCQVLTGCQNLTVYGEGNNNALSKLAKSFYNEYVDVSEGCDKVLGVTFRDTDIKIAEGEKVALNAVVYPKVKKNAKLSYVSSDESVATVDSKGNVQGIANGICYITATSKDGAYARCQVTIAKSDKPKNTKIVKLTSKSKGFDIIWKKQSTQVNGYEIEYSTNSKFTKKTTKNIKITKNNTTSKKIRKLNAGKKYYVRIRTYKNVKGKVTPIYSEWSKPKSITTKK